MKLLIQLLLLFTICMAGQLISNFLPIPIPSSVISLVLLLILLLTKILKPASIKELSEFLLANMAFFFIPAGVNILEYYNLLKGNILVLLLICLITTFLTFFVSSYTVIAVTRLLERRKQS